MIIGFGGNKGVGKNTAALVLEQWYGFKGLSFAGPLKEIVSKTFAIPMQVMDDPKLKDTPFKYGPKVMTISSISNIVDLASEYQDIERDVYAQVLEIAYGKEFNTPRQLTQYVGTDLIRKYVDDQFWVKAFMNDATKYQNIVVTDVRFPNERVCIKEMSGTLALVKRPNTELKDNHISEQSLGADIEYDIVFDNNTTVKDLHLAVDSYYNKIK